MVVRPAFGEGLPIPVETAASHDGGVTSSVLKHGHLTDDGVRAAVGGADHRVGGGASRRDRDAATRTRRWRPLVVGGAARLQGDTGPLTDGVRRNRDDNLRRGMDGHIYLGGRYYSVNARNLQRILTRLAGTRMGNGNIRDVCDSAPSPGSRPVVVGICYRIFARQHQRVPFAKRSIVGDRHKQVAVRGGGGILIHEIERDNTGLSAIVREEKQVPFPRRGVGDKTPFR